MRRPIHLRNRLHRVLALGEEILRELTGRGAEPADLERYPAFRWDAGRGPGRLVPIPQPARFDLADLIGVERAVGPLVRNTEQLLRGLPAQHVLLYGERGTGKSSAVRGLLDRFAGRGLRLVEVRKADLVQLPRVLAALRGAAEELRFLLFCDDLSFDPGEPGVRELKAALEGSFEAPPAHVRIVVTSNRRHLLPESTADARAARVDARGDLHLGEVLDEKLALSDRFGLRLGFYAFDQETYLAIAAHHAKRVGIDLGEPRVREAALRWALRRGSRTGRSARQFVEDLAGSRGLGHAPPADARERDGGRRDGT